MIKSFKFGEHLHSLLIAELLAEVSQSFVLENLGKKTVHFISRQAQGIRFYIENRK